MARAKSKVQQRTQKVGDTRYIRTSEEVRKARRVMRPTTTSNVHPSCLELAPHHSLPQVMDKELQDVMFVLVDFSLTLVPLTSVLSIHPSGMGKFNLCHCMLTAKSLP